MGGGERESAISACACAAPLPCREAVNGSMQLRPLAARNRGERPPYDGRGSIPRSPAKKRTLALVMTALRREAARWPRRADLGAANPALAPANELALAEATTLTALGAEGRTKLCEAAPMGVGGGRVSEGEGRGFRRAPRGRAQHARRRRRMQTPFPSLSHLGLGGARHGGLNARSKGSHLEGVFVSCFLGLDKKKGACH